MLLFSFAALAVGGSVHTAGDNNKKETEMNQFISKWAIEHNIAQRSLNSLLIGLKMNCKILDEELPKSSKTLLKTEKARTNVLTMNGGTYCHTGIEKTLTAVCATLIESSQAIPNELTIDFNIDGVNHTKSTKTSLWLIQLHLRHFNFDPFVIGTYCGIHKPNCNDFLKEFVAEMNILLSKGFKYDDKLITVKLGYFSCDTPATAYIRGTKGHTGRNACIKCNQKGISLNNRFVFPQITEANRTDEDFRKRKDPEHHVKNSILEQIHDLDMVNSFPVDVMHIVHLGIMKKLVTFWTKDLKKIQLEQILSRVKIAESQRPFEIRRQIRHITECGLFKAKEFRTLLMYTGQYIKMI